MIMAPVSLPSSCQQRDTEVGLVSDNYPPSTILARKRASVHIIEGSTSAKRISLLFKNSRCRSFSESWAFLSTSSGVSPINEREGQNSHNKNGYKGGIKSINNNITDSAPTPSTLRLSPLRPTGTDIDVGCDSASSSPTLSPSSTLSSSSSSSLSSATTSSSVATSLITAITPATPEPTGETTTLPISSSSSLSELPPSSLNLFRQPAVTGATAYEDLPDQELLKTLAAFLRGDSSPSDKKGNRPSAAAATSRSNQDKDESEMSDLVVTVRDFAYPKTHPYHTGNYPPEPKYEESDIEEDEEEDYTEETAADSSIPGAADDERDRTEGYARGLYDFDAENSSELSFKEGEFVWIHCRQFPGWFLGEKDGAQGLVPENYVQLV